MREKKIKRNKLIKLMLWSAFLLLVIDLLSSSFSRYSGDISTDAQVEVAYYVFKEGSISSNLKLTEFAPGQSYTYTFTVANYEGTKRTEATLDYNIQVRTTTNLPLTYKIYKQGTTTDLVDDIENRTDDDGTYFKYITTADETFGHTQNELETYELVIEYPSTSKSAEYESTIEFVEITINSKQKIS